MAEERVKWYRNASEKDQDKIHGKGVLVAIMPRQNNSGGSAVIVDDDGNFVEKDLSLIKVERLNVSVDTEVLIANDTAKLNNEIKNLKDKIIELNKKVTPTTVPKSGKPIKK